MSSTHYVGQELDLFAHATNWKNYWSSQIKPLLGGDVLEVGAGLGANTQFLYSHRINSWTCLEPDPELVARMFEGFSAQPALRACITQTGTLEALAADRRFDVILYIDVLEHIKDDWREMASASSHLRQNGRIIVLAPAHQFLYTPFDKAIGHFRRYDRSSLSRCTPAGCRIERMLYLDSVGLLASLSNRLWLQQSTPTLNQILTWDKILVPVSRLIDPLTFRQVGKSILGIWKRDNREPQ